MKMLGIIILSIILGTLLEIGLFALVAKVASWFNGVGFYEQLCLWFGHGSNFAKLFIK